MYMRRWFLNFYDAFLWRKRKFKFLLDFMKTLTNFEDPYWNPLQNACCGIQEAACDSVNCSLSRRWWWKIQKNLKLVSSKPQADDWLLAFQRLNCSLWGAAELENLMRLPVKSPLFIEASRNLESIFLNKKDAKNIKNHQRMYRKYWVIWFWRPSKKCFISWKCPFELMPSQGFMYGQSQHVQSPAFYYDYIIFFLYKKISLKVCGIHSVLFKLEFFLSAFFILSYLILSLLCREGFLFLPCNN